MEQFSAVKFAMGYKKNMSFHFSTKISKSLKKPDWAPLMVGNK